MAQSRNLLRAQAVGRILWRLSNRHRAVRGGVAAAKGVGKATARATRILVLEITGFFFAVFAAMGLAAVWRQWQRIESGQGTPVSHVVVTLLFVMAFIYFSVSSFWRARHYAAVKGSGNG